MLIRRTYSGTHLWWGPFPIKLQGDSRPAGILKWSFHHGFPLNTVLHLHLYSNNFHHRNFPEFSPPSLPSIIFSNIFISVEESNHMKVRRETRRNYTENWLHSKCFQCIFQEFLELLGERVRWNHYLVK